MPIRKFNTCVCRNKFKLCLNTNTSDNGYGGVTDDKPEGSFYNGLEIYTRVEFVDRHRGSKEGARKKEFVSSTRIGTNRIVLPSLQ